MIEVNSKDVSILQYSGGGVRRRHLAGVNNGKRAEAQTNVTSRGWSRLLWAKPDLKARAMKERRNREGGGRKGISLLPVLVP